MIIQRARSKIRKHLPQTIINVKQTSPKFIIVLTIMGIIFFYVVSLIIGAFFNIKSFTVPVQELFFLVLLGVCIAFPWYILDQPPHLTFWDAMTIMIAIGFSFFFLVVVAPKAIPSMFHAPASMLKMSMYSMLGLP